MSWHRQYRGKNIGRVLHFVYHYCGFDVMEMCVVGRDYIEYNGKKIAKYTWLENYDDIPVFEFLNGPFGDQSRWFYVDVWKRNQKEKFFEAISDCEPPKKEPCRECQALKIQLAIMTDDQ